MSTQIFLGWPRLGVVTLFFLMGQASSSLLPGEWLASVRYLQLVISLIIFSWQFQRCLSALSENGSLEKYAFY